MAVKYIDCHTHPIKMYYEDNFHVIEKAHSKGLVGLIITGCNAKENDEVINICKYFDYTFPVIGIHPTESNGKIDGKTIERQLTKDVVGIGEIGLDYYYPDTNKKVQKESFIAQIKVAQKHRIPVVVHMRDSYEDLYGVIKQFPDVKFMIHTYSGDLNWAKKFYELGCYFSISGVVTYKNSKELREAVKWIPVDRILTETDAPYLAPQQKRGEKNYPNYVIYTANFIAGLKNIPIEKFTKQVLKNAKELFKINV